MSTIRRKPFIEKAVAKMNETERTSLVNVLNNGGNNIFATFGNLPNKNTVTPVFFKLSETKTKTGILIYTDDHTSQEETPPVQCVLICYHRFQDLLVYDIDVSKSTYRKVEEYLDINELRRILTEIKGGESSVTPEDILDNVEGSDDVVVDLNETDDKVQIRLDQDVKDLIFYKKALLADVEHEITETDTIITVNGELFNPDSAYELLLEIEGEGSHYGTRVIVFPYNNSQCFTSSNLYMAQTEDNKVIATMDNDGQVNITILGYKMTPESQTTTVHYKKLF